jgi:hypothetical protein
MHWTKFRHSVPAGWTEAQLERVAHKGNASVTWLLRALAGYNFFAFQILHMK